jgi:capsular polysaccharide biosynthesis protein
VNADEVIPILAKYGFRIFEPEKYSFLEQVFIFSQVKFLVGEHGAGLTNLMFMDKGASVLELHKARTNDLNHPSAAFWYLAHAAGVNYYHQICDTHGREDYFEGDYVIDPAMLDRNLELMLAGTS